MERGPTPLVSTLAEEFARSRRLDSVGPLDLAHFERAHSCWRRISS